MQSNRLAEEKYMDTSRTGQEFPLYTCTSNLPITKYTALARQVLTQIKLVKRKDIQLMHCVAQVKKILDILQTCDYSLIPSAERDSLFQVVDRLSWDEEASK